MRRAVLAGLAIAAGLSAQTQPFNVDALLRLSRISDPQISPDGRLVAFVVGTIDVPANKRPKQIWLVPVTGGTPRPITPAGSDSERPRWSPDSRRIAFISDRSGTPQVWTMDAEGANPKQITNLASEAGGVLYSPDGKNLIFTSDVYPVCGADDGCNRKHLDEEKARAVKARIYTGLLYRHWKTWDNSRRSHLLVVPVDGGTPRDLTPGERDVPPFSLGGQDGYALSPDGAELCYAMSSDPVPALGTNLDLYVVAVAGGPARKITLNQGADTSPVYSRDGKYIAYRSQYRGGYESDRWRLQILERATGKVTNLTESLDRWIDSFVWSPDSSKLFFTAGDRGRQPIQFISVNGGEIRTAISGDNHLDEMQFTPDGKSMVYTQQSGSRPAELFRASATGGAPVPLTRLNDPILTTYSLTPLEEFWVAGAENDRVQSFLVKPFGFQPGRKYPVLMLIHGGPQGAWGQSWSYRWNAQVFAASGFVVVMPNPRGSTGYGQKFIDQINRDWGGRAFEDVMAVADHIVAEVPYADGSRMAAAGGSYGGYMVDWILGHTQRFKALVSHAGVFDLMSEFGETEELWFPVWEFGGPPWENPEVYARWSPSHYAKEFRTPTLVLHGELDYRVPVGQGLQLFTALQVQKIPSKLVLFPDEGHWILKPQNTVLWYNTFIDWIRSWTK